MKLKKCLTLKNEIYKSSNNWLDIYISDLFVCFKNKLFRSNGNKWI